MAVFQVERNKGYTVMNNHHLRNKELQTDCRVRLCGFLEQNVRRVFYLHKLPAEMHKAGLDKAQRCADRLVHGKEPLKPMAHKPAYDGVDAVFVNGGRFIHDLGIVYNSLGEYNKAKGLYEKSLRINEKILGAEHPDTATGYDNLALVYNSLREYRKAEKLCEKGLLIREKVLGTEHLDTAMSYHNLVGIYDSQGEYKTALTYYLKSYKVLVLKLGLNDSNTQMVYENMKSAFYECDAKSNFKQWLEENRKES